MTYTENELLKNRLARNLNRRFRKYLITNELRRRAAPIRKSLIINELRYLVFASTTSTPTHIKIIKVSIVFFWLKNVFLV